MGNLTMSNFNMDNYQKQVESIITESFNRCDVVRLIAFVKHSDPKLRVSIIIDADLLSKYYSYLLSEYYDDIPVSHRPTLITDNVPNPFVSNITFIKDLITYDDFSFFKRFCLKYNHQCDSVKKLNREYDTDIVFSPVLSNGSIVDNTKSITIQAIKDPSNWIIIGYKYVINGVI